MNTATTTIAFTVAPATATEQYWQGFNAYMRHEPYSAMTTRHEKRGYMAANRAEAESAIAGYADKRGF